MAACERSKSVVLFETKISDLVGQFLRKRKKKSKYWSKIPPTAFFEPSKIPQQTFSTFPLIRDSIDFVQPIVNPNFFYIPI